QSDRLQDEAQAENEDFLNKLDENIQKIIKEQVKTSYAVAADLSKLELKKILIEKMESNKSIYRSDEQKNLYKALVDTYKCDKLIINTYRDMVTLKRHRDDEDKDEESFAGSNRVPREDKKEKNQSQPMYQRKRHLRHLASQLKGPNLNTRLLKQAKPPTPDSAWNKTLSATHGRIQPWISNLAKKADSRTSFNKLMDIPVDFSAFVMNRLKVDTLTPELLAGPT
nr:hypothetical protein [Tanacetum cinerariifolium]